MAITGSMLLGSCTKNFQKYNTDPIGLSDADLYVDFNILGTPLHAGTAEYLCNQSRLEYPVAAKPECRFLLRLYGVHPHHLWVMRTIPPIRW